MNQSIQTAERKLADAEKLVAEARADLASMRQSEPVYTHVVDGNGRVCCASLLRDDIISSYATQGRTFTSLAEAELFSKRERLLKRYRDKIAELNDGWAPDWANTCQHKGNYYWCHETATAKYTERNWTQNQDSCLYFDPDIKLHLLPSFTRAELCLILTGRELGE